MTDRTVEPVSVAIVDDYEVVVRGVAEMLGPSPHLRVVELDSMIDPSVPVDLLLFDSFGADQGVGPDLLRLLRHRNVGRLVVYSWNTDPSLVDMAREAGVHGYLSKKLTGDELVRALLRVAGGEAVFQSDEGELSGSPAEHRPADTSGDWPGRQLGLTAREAEVVGLIVQGLTNQQIAQRAYLSINSVKTYIRSAYRKMGVERRSEAILWGIDHGFLPRPRQTRLGA